jgi:hypothetical protein
LPIAAFIAAVNSAVRAARDERVVRRYARLAGVEELAHRDLWRDRIELAVGIDDHRRFSAKLERDRGQVLGGGLRHEAADGGRTGEEQMIERQFDERLADCRIAGEHRELVLREELAHDADHELGRPGREFGRLDHHAIACRERAERRQHRQLVRIVPRRDHADDAERLRQQPVVTRSILEVGRDPLRSHPAADVPQRMLDRFVDGKEVGDQCFVRRAMTEVGGDRIDDVGRMAFRHSREARKPVAADRERRRHVRARRRSHPLECLPQRQHRGGRKDGKRVHGMGSGGSVGRCDGEGDRLNTLVKGRKGGVSGSGHRIHPWTAVPQRQYTAFRPRIYH